MRGLGLWVLIGLIVGLANVWAWAADDAPAGTPMPNKPAAEKKADHADHADDHGHHEFDAMSHVRDAKEFEFFGSFGPKAWHLPKILGIQITKFMVLQVIAALLIVIIYIPLAWRLADGRAPRGACANAFEVLLTFIRDQVARPNIGEHDGDKYVPFLWTLFLFILFNNLLGMIPFGASATADISVTGALALIVFFVMHGAAIAKMGFKHYMESMWPHLDVPFPMGYFIKPLVCFLEIIGLLVKNAVLAVRLFANMFAGHMVLATILGFIYQAAGLAFGLWTTITVGCILGIVALSLLELFVAFLQAYIFVFLTSLFMGMVLHPQH